MTPPDFATTVAKILNNYGIPLLATRKGGSPVLAALVAAHEADKREAVREARVDELLRPWGSRDEWEVAKGAGLLNQYELDRMAALDTPPDSNGIGSDTTSITPLGDNAAGNRTNSRKDKS